MGKDKAVKRILEYYRSTADVYDAMHLCPVDKHVGEHAIALNLISGFIECFDFKTILDVGCGTGRGLKYLTHKHPNLYVTGIDLSSDLVNKCIEKGIPRSKLLCGDACLLPFEDSRFDAVMSLALLHHVPDPNRVIREMLRVARNAIFVSDSNRYGQGSLFKRVMKLCLYRVLRMGQLVDYIRTRGKMYMHSEGDGVFYSFSVFDVVSVLRQKMTKVIAIPTRGQGDLSAFSILKSSHFLICAFEADNQ